MNQREIKFRAWTGATMEYNVSVGKFGAFYVNPGARGDGLDDKDSACLTPFTTIYPPTTPVMQFTGLKDKNGKEIYEGDLIRVLDAVERPYIVHAKWDDELAGFHRVQDYRYGEVIGNIWEHPHLL